MCSCPKNPEIVSLWENGLKTKSISEWQLLTSIEDIVEESLPNKKLADHFQEPDGAKLCILNKKAF